MRYTFQTSDEHEAAAVMDAQRVVWVLGAMFENLAKVQNKGYLLPACPHTWDNPDSGEAEHWLQVLLRLCDAHGVNLERYE